MKDYTKYGISDVKKCMDLFEKEGFGYLYIKNDGKKAFSTTATFNQMGGLKLEKPHRGNQINLVVQPGSEEIAIISVSNKGYSLSIG